MIKLFGGGGNRWVRPYWTLRELDVPFEPIKISIMKGETQTPEFLKLNPFGKLPALQDGDFQLFESAAICNYLADKYPEKGLAPKTGTKSRAIYDQWISMAISDLEQPLWRITRHKFIYPELNRSTAEIELAKADFHKIATVLEGLLKTDYLVDSRFSVADIVMTYTLRWATAKNIMDTNQIEPFKNLQEYMKRHIARPKFPSELYE